MGLAIAATYVKPQTASAYYGAPNLTQAAPLPSKASQKTAKLDHEFTNWWRASLSYLRYYSLEPGNTWFPTVSSPDQWLLERRVDTTQFNNILTISPTTVLTVRYGFNRFPNYGYQVSQGFNLASLGFDPSYVAAIASPTFPNVTMTSQYSLGTNNNFYYVHHSKNFSASLSKYQGRHNLKGGFDYRRIHDDGNDFANSAGAFTFNGVFSRSTPLTAVSGTGADLADMLLGAPSAGTGYIPTKLYEYADYYGAYFQDDIRITKSLTVNVGMRWEREYGLQEKNNSMVVGFDTKTRESAGGQCHRHPAQGRDPVRRRERQQHPRQQSEPEQDGAAHRHRLAGGAEDDHPRRLRHVLGAAVRHRHAVQSAGLHRDLHLRRVQRRQRDAGQQSHQPVPRRARPADRQHAGRSHRHRTEPLASSIRMRARRACSSTRSTCSASCRSAWRWKWATSGRTPRTSRRRRPTSTSTR